MSSSSKETTRDSQDGLILEETVAFLVDITSLVVLESNSTRRGITLAAPFPSADMSKRYILLQKLITLWHLIPPGCKWCFLTNWTVVYNITHHYNCLVTSHYTIWWGYMTSYAILTDMNIKRWKYLKLLHFCVVSCHQVLKQTMALVLVLIFRLAFGFLWDSSPACQ